MRRRKAEGATLFELDGDATTTPKPIPVPHIRISAMLGPWQTNAVHPTDSLAGLRQMPPDCIDVAVTSPPYWGQRGNDGLGLEEDPRDYVRNLTEVLAEVMRCLKPSGTFWLNIGDSYNTPINWRCEDYSYSSLGADGTGLPKTNSAYTKNRGNRRAFIRDCTLRE